MLVRSASTPLFNTWAPHHNSTELSPETELLHTIPKPHSFKMTRAQSDTNLLDLSVPKWKSSSLNYLKGVVVGAGEDEDFRLNSLDRLFTSSGLGESVEEEEENVSIEGGGIGSFGGRSNGGNGDGGFDFHNNDDSTDSYYQKMINENPGNGLILGNYARFLKEVRGDVVKAEEYCERAILANPHDGNVVSMYADLMWEIHKDASRAEKYFGQAVQVAPEDSYVMASYAKFLWDAEEENEEEEEEDEEQDEEVSECRRIPKARSHGFLHETSTLQLRVIS